jgi:hypothetical protein
MGLTQVTGPDAPGFNPLKAVSKILYPPGECFLRSTDGIWGLSAKHLEQ